MNDEGKCNTWALTDLTGEWTGKDTERDNRLSGAQCKGGNYTWFLLPCVCWWLFLLSLSLLFSLSLALSARFFSCSCAGGGRLALLPQCIPACISDSGAHASKRCSSSYPSSSCSSRSMCVLLESAAESTPRFSAQFPQVSFCIRVQLSSFFSSFQDCLWGDMPLLPPLPAWTQACVITLSLCTHT